MSASDSGSTGLRERKKMQTRLAIRREAFRLFTEQGYAETTIEQIAAAAEAVLQHGPGNRQKQKESKGYEEVDGAADTAPAERSVVACPESEARHQHKLNDFQLIMASRVATGAPPDGSLCLRIMPELTAEQVQRGRGPDPTALARRKLINREVRSAREKLTSSTGLQRAFDYELVRVFTQYRLNGSAGTLLLAFLVAAAAAAASVMVLAATPPRRPVEEPSRDPS